MHLHRNSDIFASCFVRKLRGGSQPILIGASDGKQYVLKFANNLQGPNVLCNEVLGTELYRAIGLPAPPWAPIIVTKKFLRDNPGCRIEGSHGWIDPEPGLHFGSLLIGDSPAALFEMLPGTYWGRVCNRSDFWLAWLVDLCAEHWDNRQAVFLQDSGVFSAMFIDHGHMFGGPDGSRKTPVSGPRHLDRRVYTTLDDQAHMNLRQVCASIRTDELPKLSGTVPDIWATQSSVENFHSSVERLARADFLQNTLEAMRASFDIPDADRLPILGNVLRSCLRLATSMRGAVA